MSTSKDMNSTLFKIIVPTVVVLIGVIILFFVFNKSEKKKDFINSIVGIQFAIKKAANLSTNGRIDIRTLPKTINLDNKEYFLDYKQDILIIKNFNDEDLCNQEISLAGIKGVFVTGGIKTITTSCTKNNMTIKLKYSGENDK